MHVDKKTVWLIIGVRLRHPKAYLKQILLFRMMNRHLLESQLREKDVLIQA